VVVVALVDAAAVLELGHQRAERAEVVEGAQRPVGARQAQEAAELVGQALPGRPPDRAGVGARPGRGARVDGEPQLLGQAGEAQQAHRIVGQRGGPHQPQPARRQVVQPAVPVDRSRLPHHRHGQRVHGEVAPGQVLLQAAALHRGDVHLGAQAPALHAPGAEGARQPEAAGPVLPRERRRRGGRVALERHVDVGHRPPQQGVAHPAAHRPGPLAERGERRHQGRQRLPAHPLWIRGTRAPIPQTIS
jgi:hypothetical protein